MILHAGEDDWGVSDNFRNDVMRLIGKGDIGTIAALPILKEALERARVVGVLDGWAAANPGQQRRVLLISDGPGFACLWTVRCCFYKPDGENWTWCEQHGPTPDAARAAAARAIEAGEV